MSTERPLVVRRAGPDDAATVLRYIRELAAHQDQIGHVTVSLDRWRELLVLDDVIVLLALRGDEPVGYVSAVHRIHLWSGTSVLALDDVYISSPHRSQGIGKRLLHELAVHANGATITWGGPAEQPARDPLLSTTRSIRPAQGALLVGAAFRHLAARNEER